MPNVDVVKVALLVVLVAALVALGAWFADEVAAEIVTTGMQASGAMESSAVDSWGLVSGLFGASWGLAWSVALKVAVMIVGSLVILRVIKVVQG